MTFEELYGFDLISDKWPTNWYAPVTLFYNPNEYWLKMCMLKYQQQGLFK